MLVNYTQMTYTNKYATKNVLDCKVYLYGCDDDEAQMLDIDFSSPAKEV